MLLATSEQAAAQPTATGQELHRIRPWMGHLYAAYGDYGANTGPVDAISVDLATPAGFVSEITLQTEATWGLRDLDTCFYLPLLDPIGMEDPTTGQLAIASAPGDWTVITNVTPVPIHVMSVLHTADGIYLGGASNSDDGGGATVWFSGDNAATWTRSLGVRPARTGFDRVYALTEQPDGTVYAYVSSIVSHVWALPPGGGTWTRIAPFWQVAEAWPFSWQGHPFDLCLRNGKPEGKVTPGPAMAFAGGDETLRASIEGGFPGGLFVDALVHGGYLYLLDDNGTVHRCDADGVWTSLFTVDQPVVCMTKTDAAWFFGTGDSKVYTVA